MSSLYSAVASGNGDEVVGDGNSRLVEGTLPPAAGEAPPVSTVAGQTGTYPEGGKPSTGYATAGEALAASRGTVSGNALDALRARQEADRFP